jgi:purine catabolism regulator
MVVLADLLAQRGLALGSTHVPAPERPVRWVATSELPDPTPYLEGGEVLLTTGLETAGWTEEWREYVARLAQADVAALGLGIGLTHDAPPPELVAACREHDVNLFAVPRPTTFVAISRAAAGLLEAERETATRRALEVQRTLTQAALRLDDTSALLTELAAVVGGAAVTVTRDGETSDGPHGARSPELDLATVRTEVARMRAQGLRAAASVATGAGTTIVRPLGVRARPELWLAVLVPGRPDDSHRTAVNTAVSLMSLALESSNERRTTDRSLRARAVELLLAGDPRTAAIVLEATSSPVRLPARLRVLRARGPAEAREDVLALLEQERVLAAVLEGELVIACSARRTASTADRLAERGLQVGVGRVVGADEFAAGHDTAGHALAATTPAVPVRTWDALVEAGVVGLVGTDRARAYARALLAPLDADPLLLDTLRSFLVHHGARGEVAAELGVHRNTVRNRVEQIEALLGGSLDDPQVRVNAWFALQVERVVGPAPA